MGLVIQCFWEHIRGVGYPSDEELDYNEYLDKEPEKIKKYLGPDIPYSSKKQWAIFRDEENMAKFRMRKCWQMNKKSFIKSYFVIKPFGVVSGSFYWKEIFHVSHDTLVILKRVDLAVCVLCLIAALFLRDRLKEIVFVGLAYLYQVALYSYTFAFDRYGQVLIFLRYIIIGWMIFEVYKRAKAKRI